MYNKLFVFILLLFISYSGYPQTEPITIERSKNKVIIGGKLYYVHIVEKGNTLYSISKAYNVSQKIIADENPDILFGLKIGQALKIPFVPDKSENKTKQNKYIVHTIKYGQTLYYLSKLYNVSQEDILKLNPGIDYNDFKINQVIKIPKKEYIVKKTPVSTEEKFIYHKVEPKETLYSLSKRYNVSIEQIIATNKEMEGYPKHGQYIRIPIVEVDTLESVLLNLETEEIDTTQQISMEHVHETYTDFDCDSYREYSTDEEYNVALLLPILLNMNTFNTDTIERDTIIIDPYGYAQRVKKEQGIYEKSYNFLEFYEGAMIAVNTLNKAGLSINLFVYDTERDISRMEEIIYQEEFNSLDLIIGRISLDNLEILADHFNNDPVSIISPMPSGNDLVKYNRNFFQFNTPFTIQLDEFLHFAAQFYDKNIVFVYEQDSLQTGFITDLKQKLFSRLSYYKPIDQILFKEVVYQDSISFLEQAMLADTGNVVIVPSNKRPFVSNVITSLNTLQSLDYDITVLGFPRWLMFDNIHPDYFFNLKTHVFTTYFVDYDLPQVKKFINEYRSAYKTEPSAYSFQGYDMTFYFLNALKLYGRQFWRCLPNIDVNVLQSDFKFERVTQSGGFENRAVSIVKYDDEYHIHKVDTTYQKIISKNFEKNLEDFYVKDVDETP